MRDMGKTPGSSRSSSGPGFTTPIGPGGGSLNQDALHTLVQEEIAKTLATHSATALRSSSTALPTTVEGPLPRGSSSTAATGEWLD